MYGKPPLVVGTFEVDAPEWLFYQDMPIKLAGDQFIELEERLYAYEEVYVSACEHFIRRFGRTAFDDAYIYLSAKNMFCAPGCSYNREGYHCDGFGTDDINYIWSDKFPTIFNVGHFELSEDDTLSMQEMEAQASPENEIQCGENVLLMLDPFVIHKVAPVTEPAIRNFLKITFSKGKYDLKGNTHNYLLDYNWEMRPRQKARNVPRV